MNSIRTLRTVAIAEATSFLVLLVAMYFKYSEDSPGGVQVMGPIHGVLFLAYLYVAINVYTAQKWAPRTLLLLFAGGVVPLGGYVVDRQLNKLATA